MMFASHALLSMLIFFAVNYFSPERFLPIVIIRLFFGLTGMTLFS